MKSINRYSLHIGCNYTGTPHELRGCHNDAKDMYKFFSCKGYTSTILIDAAGYEQPTASKIRKELTRLCKALVSGDILVISYSGHGVQQRDVDGDEKSGMDQCICPSDMASSGYIVDDEMYQMVGSAVSGSTIYAFFDCCHSGSILDLRYNYNPVMKNYIDVNVRRVSNAKVCCISGCTDMSTSADAWIDDRFCGALSWSLLRCLNTRTYIGVDLINNICSLLKKKGYSQVPQLSCGNVRLTAADAFIF